MKKKKNAESKKQLINSNSSEAGNCRDSGGQGPRRHSKSPSYWSPLTFKASPAWLW